MHFKRISQDQFNLYSCTNLGFFHTDYVHTYLLILDIVKRNKLWKKSHIFFWNYFAGLELARVPRVPGTCRNSEHHLCHPRILRFLILKPSQNKKGQKKNPAAPFFEYFFSAASCKKVFKKCCSWKFFWPGFNWHPQSSFSVTTGTLSFKFLTQPLLSNIEMKLDNFIYNFFCLLKTSELYLALFCFWNFQFGNRVGLKT